MSEIVHWRAFIVATVARELRSRYTRSLLGAAWLVLPALVLIAVYALVFSRLMRGAGLPDHGPYTYSVYLCAGMLTWQWFSELVQRTQGLFINHAALIRKTTVPWSVLLCCDALVISAGLGIQLLLLGALLAAVGLWPGASGLLWLPLLVVQALLAVALGLVLAVFHVFFRDVGLALPLALQMWFWLTPIVYPLAIVPPELAEVLAWNPLWPLVQGYQAALVPGLAAPSWSSVATLAAAALLMAMLARRLVHRNLGRIRDEL